MFRLDSEKELLETFRSRDRAHVELPAGRTFPLTSLDYLTWTDEGGERVYLVFKAPGDRVASGILFRREKGNALAGPGMCHWCNSHGSSTQVVLFSADKSSKKRVGVYLCRDLACGAHVEDDANRKGKNARDAMHALLEKMAKFSREALGIRQDNRNQPVAELAAEP